MQPTRTSDADFDEGPFFGSWVGNTSHTLAFELTAKSGPEGRPVRVHLDVALSEDLAPSFQLKLVQGTADRPTIEAMARAAHGMLTGRNHPAFALDSRIEMDLSRLRGTLGAVDGDLARLAPGRTVERLTRQRPILVERIDRLEFLRGRMRAWFEGSTRKPLDDLWSAGGGTVSGLLDPRSEPGASPVAARDAGDRMSAVLVDPSAPARILDGSGIGVCFEAVGAAVERARAEGVRQVHFITDASDMSHTQRRPAFVPELAGTYQLITPSLTWLANDGRIGPEDLLVAECPEPFAFHLDRVVVALERLGLDMPIVAFNRTTGAIGRTAAQREHANALVEARQAPVPAGP